MFGRHRIAHGETIFFVSEVPLDFLTRCTIINGMWTIVFVSYTGVTPCITTIDPEFIKEVTATKFNNFTDVFDIDFAPGQTTLDVSR